MDIHAHPLMDDVCAPSMLTRPERIGLLFTVVCSTTSLAAILGVLLALAIHIVDNQRKPNTARHRIFASHLDVYMMSLLTSDSITTLGGTFNLKWVLTNTVTCGTTCDVQGYLGTVSGPATAIATIAIAVHTFSIVALSRRPDPRDFRLPFAVVFFSWLYGIIFVAVAKAREVPGRKLFSPTPHWCWISQDYNFERIPAAFMWYWLAAGISTVLYVPLFFVIRRNLEFDTYQPWKMSFRCSPPDVVPSRVGGIDTVKQGRKALLYSGVQLVVLVPNSVVRLFDFQGRSHIPTAWYFLCACLFGLNGVANVLLLLFTRSRVLGFKTEAMRMQQIGSVSVLGSSAATMSDETDL